MTNYPPSTLRRSRLFVAMVMLIAAPVVRAQTPASTPPAADLICVLAFVDVDPRQADQALALLRAYGDASRRAPGARRFEVLRELARTNHFALLETWDSEAARQAHEVSDATKQFRARLQPFLGSPFDERLSHSEPF
jgi:quinol monooxygenase YgiN